MPHPDDRPARVLLIHAEYRQRGGEEAVVAAESDLLRARGHAVELLSFDNAAWAGPTGVTVDVRRGVDTVWSSRALSRARRTVHSFGPDIVHVHNTFPSASPAVYAAAPPGVAVVQTLHNYRLMCPVATFFRDGHVCTDCRGRMVPLPGVVHACYRGSRGASATVATMLAVHNVLGTWHRRVDRFVALTDFARGQFVTGGLPAERISVKPNFLDAPPAAADHPRRGFLFVGRLAPEKGLVGLLSACRAIGAPLTVIGTGGLEPAVDAAAAEGYVRALGQRPQPEVDAEMHRATALVFPSIWFEGFPMTLLEAFAARLPVIASSIGGIPEIVTDGTTGLLFPPGNVSALADRMQWAEAHPAEMRSMAENAHEMLAERFSPDRNYRSLTEIYGAAMEHARAGGEA